MRSLSAGGMPVSITLNDYFLFSQAQPSLSVAIPGIGEHILTILTVVQGRPGGYNEISINLKNHLDLSREVKICER